MMMRPFFSSTSNNNNNNNNNSGGIGASLLLLIVLCLVVPSFFLGDPLCRCFIDASCATRKSKYNPQEQQQQQDWISKKTSVQRLVFGGRRGETAKTTTIGRQLQNKQ